MIKRMFAIYDAKTQVYHPPFMAHNEQDAMRQVLEVISEGRNMISKYPADYTLVEVGSFDDSKGIVTGSDCAKIIIQLDVLKNPESEVTND